jgi:hypothetical protein
MNPTAKILVITGLILIIAGVIWQLFGKYLHLGRLPGDIVIEKENVRFYFPIMTSIIVSIILSVVFAMIRWFR